MGIHLNEGQVAQLVSIHRQGMLPEKGDREGLQRIVDTLDCTYAQLVDAAGPLWKSKSKKRKSYGDTSSQGSSSTWQPKGPGISSFRAGSTALPSPPRTNHSTPQPLSTPSRERLVSNTPTPSRPQSTSYMPSTKFYSPPLGCPTPPNDSSEALEELLKQKAAISFARDQIEKEKVELAAGRESLAKEKAAFDIARGEFAKSQEALATQRTQLLDLLKKEKAALDAAKTAERKKWEDEQSKLAEARRALESLAEKVRKENAVLDGTKATEMKILETEQAKLKEGRQALEGLAEKVRKEHGELETAKRALEEEKKSLTAARGNPDEGELTKTRDQLSEAIKETSDLKEQLRVSKEEVAGAKAAIEDLQKAIAQAGPGKRKRAVSNREASDRPKASSHRPWKTSANIVIQRAYCAVSSAEEKRLTAAAKTLFHADNIVKPPLPAKRKCKGRPFVAIGLSLEGL